MIWLKDIILHENTEMFEWRLLDFYLGPLGYLVSSTLQCPTQHGQPTKRNRRLTVCVKTDRCKLVRPSVAQYLS